MESSAALVETDRRHLIHPLHHVRDHEHPILVVEGRGEIRSIARQAGAERYDRSQSDQEAYETGPIDGATHGGRTPIKVKIRVNHLRAGHRNGR